LNVITCIGVVSVVAFHQIRSVGATMFTITS